MHHRGFLELLAPAGQAPGPLDARHAAHAAARAGGGAAVRASAHEAERARRKGLGRRDGRSLGVDDDQGCRHVQGPRIA
ncbi:MAG: hypothetical protein GC200_08145 [Tepidisphaera sp.]|nr:hypothetical protein [Tepidisphaera sp.]